MDIKHSLNKFKYNFKRDWIVDISIIYHLTPMLIFMYFLKYIKNQTFLILMCIFIASFYLSIQISMAHTKIRDHLDKMEEK